uniref:Uncharacterized protein n=1 Tax=Arundo donax TaxID=35708 RepID=A0A0A8Y4P6_ARUDO
MVPSALLLLSFVAP